MSATCHPLLDVPRAFRLADAWHATLMARVASLLDNATYTRSGCERSGGSWRAGQLRCDAEKPFQIEAMQPRTVGGSVGR